jgi:ATP-dependent protease ClpP protease subunit
MVRRSLSGRSEVIFDVHNFGLNIDTNEIFLHPNMEVESDEVDHRTATTFIKNIRLLDTSPSIDPIIIHLNTNGGDWVYGMAIYDAIKACQKRVITVSYSQAVSISSLIPQAADYRVIMPNTIFMIHHGTIGIEDTPKGTLSYVEFNHSLNQKMIDIYSEACTDSEYFNGKTSKEIGLYIQNMIDKKQEWYMTAEESVYYGFMDKVFGTDKCETMDAIKKL